MHGIASTSLAATPIHKLNGVQDIGACACVFFFRGAMRAPVPLAS
jgi:hypothetical protein